MEASLAGITAKLVNGDAGHAAAKCNKEVHDIVGALKEEIETGKQSFEKLKKDVDSQRRILGAVVAGDGAE